MFLQSFPSGLLNLPSTRPSFEGDPALWIHQPLNGILLLAEALVILFFLRDIIFIMPPSLSCFQRWQSALSIEHNIPLARTRDKVALCLFPLYVLFIQWSGIWATSLLLIGAVLFVYAQLRKVFYGLVRHRNISDEAWQACRNTPTVLSIPLAFVWMLSMALMAVSGLVEEWSAAVLLAEASLFLVVSTFRQAENLAYRVGAFRAFLYLCALEIIPLFALVCAFRFL